jgi:potassium/hydrogen antiporter
MGWAEIQFSDFGAAYLIGSIALAIILFEGGLKTERRMIRVALWPSLVLATIGVALTAIVVGVAAAWLLAIPFTEALVIGAVLARPPMRLPLTHCFAALELRRRTV